MNFLEKPNTIWFTIAGVIISFAVSLAMLQGSVKANEKDIAELNSTFGLINAKLDKMSEKLNESSVNQAQIKVDIEYIKKAIIVVQDN